MDNYLRAPPLNKKFYICDGIQFNEANKALNSYLKNLASNGKIAGTIHKNSLTTKIIQKLFEGGEFGECRYEESSSCTASLRQTTRFYVSLYFGKLKEAERIKV